MRSKRAKRLLRFLFGIILILVLLVVSVPLWFPWILRPVAKRFGATFRSYERGGYAGFQVTDAVYTNRNVRVQAGRLAVAPWRHHAEAENWSVIVTPSNQSQTNTTPSVHRTYNKVWRIVTNVQHWVHHATVTNGYVQTPKVTVRVPGVHWIDKDFSGQAHISNALPLTTVRANLVPGGPIELSTPALRIQTTLVASNQPNGLFISSSNSWRTNQFTLSANFGTNGALPETAQLDAKSTIVPPVKGDVTAVWKDNAYSIDARGTVLERPISFAGHIKGDMKTARVENAEIVTPWASANLQGDVAFSKEILHSGSALVRNVTLGRVNPFDVAVDWSGEKLSLTNIYATARAGSSTVYAAGTANLKEKRFHVSALEIHTNKLDFTADVQWPNAASVCMQLTNFSSEALAGLVQLPNAFVFDHFRLAAGWSNGPVTGDITFSGGTVLLDGTRLGGEGALSVRSNGLSLTNLSFTRNSEPVSSAYGFLPVSINPTNNFRLTPIRNAPLHLQVNADPKAFFWTLLATNFGVALREPEVRAELRGTWDKPIGRVQARATEIKFRDAPPEVPAIESLALVAHIREQTAEIEFLNFFVTNQPVTFSALMPLPSNFWNAPHTNFAKLDWHDLSARLRIDSAQIAAFAGLTPRWIAPQGVIDADVGLKPRGQLTGHLRIDGAGTRPIESLGTLREVEILCRFDGAKAQVKSYIAAGGEGLVGIGEVALDVDRLLRREFPPFVFHVTGENVPLARQPDAIIRADLDLTVTGTNAEPVLIAGKLNLRDSLYLRELRDLIPGRLASPDRRPPYFAVTAEPFAHWRLDLQAGGQRFLKIRTPVFNGEVSADVKLFGTLGDPVAVGDLLINSGRVRFPFGTLPVSQGIISLTSDNPYRPQLLITGNDRVLGYDINMELTGFADAPVLQFTSTPPLNSDQILLMLTAGEIPRQGQIAFSTEQRAQRVAMFLGKGMLADLGIGGDSNRLTVRSGENVTETGRPTYSVEYELTDDWSVIGQYDRFNDFNLMLKWRVYSR
jgi:translocation and assembly module TamB